MVLLVLYVAVVVLGFSYRSIQEQTDAGDPEKRLSRKEADN